MGQVSVKIAGRTYPVACKDGEEERVEQLAAHVAAKADQLQTQLGQMPEPRMLLLSAIMIADELFDQTANGGVAPSSTAPPSAAANDLGAVEAKAAAALQRAADRVESLAAALEDRNTGT